MPYYGQNINLKRVIRCHPWRRALIPLNHLPLLLVSRVLSCFLLKFSQCKRVSFHFDAETTSKDDPSKEENKMDVDETTTDNEPSERGVKRSLSTDDDEEGKQSNPPSLKKHRTKEESDYREYLRLLLPYIRFQLMDPLFFSSKVLPIQILPHLTSTPLLQFFTSPSIPDQSILEAVGPSKRRDAQSVVFLKGEKRKDEAFPNRPPIVVNKGHSTFLKGTLTGRQALVFKGRYRPFSQGTTMAIRIRLTAPLKDKLDFFLSLWRSPSPLPTLCVSRDVETPNVLTFEYLDPDDEDELLNIVDFNWKEEFLSIREIVIVIKKKRAPEDDEAVHFETNLIVNSKRVKRFQYSYLKSSPAAKLMKKLSWNIILYGYMEEGESAPFLFEVSDLGNDDY